MNTIPKLFLNTHMHTCIHACMYHRYINRCIQTQALICTYMYTQKVWSVEVKGGYLLRQGLSLSLVFTDWLGGWSACAIQSFSCHLPPPLKTIGSIVPSFAHDCWYLSSDPPSVQQAFTELFLQAYLRFLNKDFLCSLSSLQFRFSLHSSMGTALSKDVNYLQTA